MFRGGKAPRSYAMPNDNCSSHSSAKCLLMKLILEEAKLGSRGGGGELPHPLNAALPGIFLLFLIRSLLLHVCAYSCYMFNSAVSLDARRAQ